MKLHRVLSIVFALLFSISLMNESHVTYAAVSNWYKSVSVQPTSTDDFSQGHFQESMRRLKATGSNAVTLIIPYYQSNLYSTDLGRGWNTPSDESLRSAIRFAKSQGLQVTLKVHAESYTGDWRAGIYPSDRDTWFGKYNDILMNYARMGRDEGVTEIVVGAELYRMAAQTQNYDNTSRWKGMISNVRSVFGGRLSYSANHTGPAEKDEIFFWDALDVIGVSAYFPLAENITNPSIEQLKSSWQYWHETQILPLYNKWKKPIMFSEIGYKSVPGAHKEPFAWWRGGGVDQTEQARDYEALFQFWNEQSYMTGIHWWDWKSNPYFDSNSDTDYTPQGKQAEQTMKKWYGVGNNSPSPSVSPTLTPHPTAFATQTPEPTPSATTRPSSYSAISVVNPTQVAPGVKTKITTTVKPNVNASAQLVDIEIYNSSGQKVAQEYYDNQLLSAQGSTFSFDWASSTPGTYSIKVGVFGAGWNGLLFWEDNSGNVIVQNQIAGTPAPTATATLTPSPTASATARPSSTPTATPTVTQTPSAKPTTSPQIQTNIDIWWPLDQGRISGILPFKALAVNLPLNQYKMYWQVDGGQLNEMGDSQQDYPHKESLVDVSGWSWSGNGSYKIGFIVKDLTGNELSKREITVLK